MNKDLLLKHLRHVADIYEDLNGPLVEVAICGGTALNLAGLLERPTKDVDVLAPDPWPEVLEKAVELTAKRFNLKPDWMNPGPVDLLRMGLPQGYFERCQRFLFRERLVYLITSRLDQIHFKLYASIDRGGYHVTDLTSLNPGMDELFQAALWCFTHDVSEGFRIGMIDFLQKMGWGNVARQLEK
ncbi:MAG TPA: hypothetical protein DF383_10290 [Deltaproteobacteria bacterium]|nr:hypothetical protein [Deltaproteobacteria bacterium]